MGIAAPWAKEWEGLGNALERDSELGEVLDSRAPWGWRGKQIAQDPLIHFCLSPASCLGLLSFPPFIWG